MSLYQFEFPGWFPLLEFGPALRNMREVSADADGVEYAVLGGENGGRVLYEGPYASLWMVATL
jgi:hypothetical protein